MAQTWPSALQTLLNEANFGIKKGSTVLRSDMAGGPQKVRRIFTKSIDDYSASINLTMDQYVIFDNFFSTTLNGGVLSFIYDHPITRVATEFRFKSEPEYSSLGGGNFQVSFVWERVP